MSMVSNHSPEVLDEMNAREEAAALAGAPASWSNPPSDEEIAAMAEMLTILPETAPAPCCQVAAPTAARRPRQKPARSVRLLSRTFGMYELPDVATVEIVISTSGPRIGNRVDTFRYTVEPIPAAFGRGFQVTRDDTAETYAVNLNGRLSTCECKGFLKHAHCKHVEGLAALVALGKL